MIQSTRFFCFFYLLFIVGRLNAQEFTTNTYSDQPYLQTYDNYPVVTDQYHDTNANSGIILSTSHEGSIEHQYVDTSHLATPTTTPTTISHQEPTLTHEQIQAQNVVNPYTQYSTYQPTTQTATQHLLPLQPPQPELLHLGVNQTISLYSTQTQQFSLILSQIPNKEGVLFFIINPYSNVSYQQTSMRLHIKNVNGTDNQLNHCQDIGNNVCLLPGTMLNVGDHLLIEIQCTSDDTCIFQLETYWSITYPLHINKALALNFDVDPNAKLFHLDIPRTASFKQLRIQLTTKTVLEPDTPLHLYANLGNLIPSKQKHDYAGIHLWDDGLGIFIHKNDIKQNILTVLVQGPASNILQLQVKAITDYHHNITQNVIQYDYIDSGQSRSYSIAVPPKKTDMNLKLTTFTGSVEILFYKDESLSTLFMTGQMESFGDRLYRLTAAHLTANNITNKLFIKVHSGATQSTYALKLTSLTQQAIQLNTDISDMGQLDKGQIANYYVNTYIDINSNESKILKFNIHHIQGNNMPVFRLCHELIQSKCHITYNTYLANKTAYNQIKPTSIVTSGNTVILKITLEPNMFVLDSHTPQYKRAIVSIVLAEETPTKFLYGIQYTDDSVIKTLREGTPMKDRVNVGSRRLYKLAPLSKDVITVHVHLVQITGSVGMFGSKIDPRSPTFDNNSLLDLPTHNELTYTATDLHNKTAYIIVHGQQNGLFSLTLTYKRNVQISHSNQYKDKFNYIAIPNNVNQKITIQPNTYEVIYLSTNKIDHTFTYSSSFHLDICARKDNLKFPRAPNCDININSTQTELPSSQSYFIGIGNPGTTTAVISVKYTNINHCEQHTLGSPWKKYMTSPTLSKCVKYTIHKNESLQIITSIDTYAYPNMHSTIYINDYEHQLNQPYIFLDSNVFSQHCNDNFCIVVILISNLTKSHVQILAQYVSHEIGLLDGISQQIFTVASVTSYKYFKFWLTNKGQTTIIVESKQGIFQFFINIKDENEHLLTDKLYPTRTESMFKSNNSYFTLYHTLTLTSQQLSKVNCTHCIMYLSVSGTEGSYVEKGRFIVEVTQQRRVLKALALTPGYLSLNSFHYYEYEFKKDTGSLVVSLSTQNTNCANTYIQKGKQRATPERNLVRSFGDQTIVQATKGTYSITLQATKDCRYTISVSQTKIKLSEIKQGVYKDMRLAEGGISFVFYHHVIDTQFKILSMQEYGQVMISATTIDRSAIQGFENLTSFDDKTVHKFFWPGNKDVLKISTTDKGYCSNCYYLIMIKALKKTLTSVMLYTSNIDVPMAAGDEVSDIIGKNEIMYFKVYSHSSSTFNISMFVHYGQVQFTVVGKHNQSKTFKKSNSTQLWTINVQKDMKKQYQAIFFNVFAKQNSMYRLVLKSNDSSSRVGDLKQMKVGYPTYVFLSSGDQVCAQVAISEKQQKLIVSASRNDKTKFQNLTVSVKMGDKTINNTKNQIIQSTMVISLPHQQLYLPSEKTRINYCFLSDSYVSLTLIPTASVTFFPENSNILVRKQQNLTINAGGKLYVEIFECEGNANVVLSKQFVKLKAGFSELMHWRRFGSNYLIEIDQTGPVYMNIDGPKTLIRWQHIDSVKGQGLGYYYFRTPHFTSSVSTKNIQFNIPPLIQTMPPMQKTTIQGINYTVMLSDSNKVLKSSIQCNIGSVLKADHFVLGSEINNTNKITFQISSIRSRFQNVGYLYASIVAEVTLITPTNITQTYRFIYEDEQIMLSNNDESKNLNVQDVHQKYGFIFWISWGIVILAVVVYFITKAIKNRGKRGGQVRIQGSSAMESDYDVDSAR